MRDKLNQLIDVFNIGQGQIARSLKVHQTTVSKLCLGTIPLNEQYERKISKLWVTAFEKSWSVQMMRKSPYRVALVDRDGKFLVLSRGALFYIDAIGQVPADVQRRFDDAAMQNCWQGFFDMIMETDGLAIFGVRSIVARRRWITWIAYPMPNFGGTVMQILAKGWAVVKEEDEQFFKVFTTDENEVLSVIEPQPDIAMSMAELPSSVD